MGNGNRKKALLPVIFGLKPLSKDALQKATYIVTDHAACVSLNRVKRVVRGAAVRL